MFFTRNNEKTSEAKRKRQDSEEESKETEQPSCSSESSDKAASPCRKNEPLSETPDQDAELKTRPESAQIDSDKCSQIIKKLFLVTMPQDFYDFWDFCISLSPKNPQGVLIN